MPKRITEMWAWTSIDPNDDEGIIGMPTESGIFLPFVGADAERMQSLEAKATEIARAVGRSVRLLRFTILEVIKEIEP